LAAGPATAEPGAPFLLDEYNVDVQAGSDSARVAAGLSFGDGDGNGIWWAGGARLAWERWQVDVPTVEGLGVGGVFGLGWRPEKVVSPYAGLALDRTFGLEGAADWIGTISAGARVRVTPDPSQHFAMTFAVVHASGFGGDGPHGGDFGVAMF